MRFSLRVRKQLRAFALFGVMILTLGLSTTSAADTLPAFQKSNSIQVATTSLPLGRDSVSKQAIQFDLNSSFVKRALPSGFTLGNSLNSSAATLANFYIVEKTAQVVDADGNVLYCIYLVSFDSGLAGPYSIYKSTDCTLTPSTTVDTTTTTEYLKFSLPPSVKGLNAYIENSLKTNGASATADDVEIVNGAGSATAESGLAQKNCPDDGEPRLVKHFKIQTEASANAAKDFYIGIDVGPRTGSTTSSTGGFVETTARNGDFSTPWEFTVTVYEQ